MSSFLMKVPQCWLDDFPYLDWNTLKKNDAS